MAKYLILAATGQIGLLKPLSNRSIYQQILLGMK